MSRKKTEFSDLDALESPGLIYRAAIFHRFPTAIWRLPGARQPVAIADLSGELKKIDVDFDALPAGFIVSPFENFQPKSTYFIQADIISTPGAYAVSCSQQENRLRLERTFQKLAKSVNTVIENDWFVPSFPKPVQSISNYEFRHWVKQALLQIRNTKLKKVVLSRCLELRLPEDFNALGLFEKLCAAYPMSLVSLVALPGIGTWIGASPEPLLCWDDRQFTTVSLAGTRANSKYSPAWSQKERHEQELVSEFIRDCFLKEGIERLEEIGPDTVEVGQLRHLCTTFRVKLTSVQPKEVATRLLRALHPTPAVCGLPKEAALKFIRSTETHPREWYAGFLGPVNFEKQTNLFVNLRCLQLLPESTILYAGSGITKDSVAEEECFETELKLNSLQRFLLPESANLRDFSKARQNKEKALCDE
jgi:isochorismate synthase